MSAGETHLGGKPLDLQIGAQAEYLLALVRRISPAILALEAQAQGFAATAQGGQHRLVQGRGAGHDRDFRLLGQLDVVVGCNRVDQHAKLEGRLAKCLDSHSRGALATIAEADDNLVALAQKAAHDLDVKRLVPGPYVAFHVVLDLQHGAVAGFDGDVVWRGRIVELRATHVGREAMYDLEGARVVDAEVAGGVGQGEFLE